MFSTILNTHSTTENLCSNIIMITTCSIELWEREQEFRHVHGAYMQGKIGKELETNVAYATIIIYM